MVTYRKTKRNEGVGGNCGGNGDKLMSANCLVLTRASQLLIIIIIKTMTRPRRINIANDVKPVS